jgi:hypothetical protein
MRGREDVGEGDECMARRGKRGMTEMRAGEAGIFKGPGKDEKRGRV